MNRLIGDLVDVVSIDAGKLALKREPCDAIPLLAEPIQASARLASEKGISLEAEPAEGALLASFDRGRVLQVLANLIGNALKFTPRAGKTAVRVARTGNELCISVRDTGTGIPAEMLETVFARFSQVRDNGRLGLGLGLYIAKCIVESHGGRIWVESKLGDGSVFYFTIPGALPSNGVTPDKPHAPAGAPPGME